jgi:signal peptidase I
MKTAPLPPPTRLPFFHRVVRPLLPYAAMVTVFLGARASLADHYRVDSGSMEPTVATGDRVVVSKLAYGLRLPLAHGYLVERAGPQRGDVVILRNPAGGPVLLKRVVAVPGDRVAVQAGRLILNGAPADRRQVGGADWERLGGRWHRLGLDRGDGPDLAPSTVPPRRYLVMGDHRGDSHDGRVFGWIARGDVLGRVEAVIARDGRPTWRRI